MPPHSENPGDIEAPHVNIQCYLSLKFLTIISEIVQQSRSNAHVIVLGELVGCLKSLSLGDCVDLNTALILVLHSAVSLTC